MLTELNLLLDGRPYSVDIDQYRSAVIEDNILLTITNYPFQFIILIGTAIIIPLMSIYVFKIIYDKFGIVGY